ncbi:MAG: hypothetical protein RMJ46_06555, partial [Bacteroidota bacterium]|nr:hypothetical protein [Bacteroidota bacterium]
MLGTSYISAGGIIGVRYVQPDNDNSTQTSFMLDFCRVVVRGPGKPRLLSPENNYYTNDNTPIFSWSPADDHTGYRLVIDNDPTFSDGENSYDNANIPPTVTSLEIENQLPEGRWYWKVAATGAGYENWSENIWRLTVDVTPPPPPANLSPENDVYLFPGIIVFRWTEVVDEWTVPEENYENYILWIDNNSDFSSPEYAIPSSDNT